MTFYPLVLVIRRAKSETRQQEQYVSAVLFATVKLRAERLCLMHDVLFLIMSQVIIFIHPA